MNNERTDADVINRHFQCDLLYLEQHFLNEPKGGAFASTLLGWGGGGRWQRGRGTAGID